MQYNVRDIVLPDSYEPSKQTLDELRIFSREDELLSLSYEIFWTARAIMMTVESLYTRRAECDCTTPWEHHSSKETELFTNLCFSIANKLENQFNPPFLFRKLAEFEYDEIYGQECEVLNILGWRPRFRCPFSILGGAQNDLELTEHNLGLCRARMLTRCASSITMDCRTTAHELAAASAVSLRCPSDDVAIVLELVLAEVVFRETSTSSEFEFCAERAARALDGMNSKSDIADANYRSFRRKELENREAAIRRCVSPRTMKSKSGTVRPRVVVPQGSISLETPSPYRQRR